MATILISHCERNLGRVEKHVGRGGELSGELGEWGVSPSEPLNSLHPLSRRRTSRCDLFLVSSFFIQGFLTFIHILQSCIYDVLVAVVSGTLQLL